MKFSNIVTKITKINKRRSYIFQSKASRIDFSLSENPTETISTKTRMALIRNIGKVNIYPLAEIEVLRKKIAKKFKLRPSNIGLGAGLEQVIENCFKTLINPGDQVIIPNPSFWLFEKSALLTNAKPVFVKPAKNFSLDLEACQKMNNKKAKLIIFSNPNNPTGQVIPKTVLENFIRAVTPTWVIIDEANIEFGGKSLVSKVKTFKNLIVLRTFSKALGLAGLRIGFCSGPVDFIKFFRQISQPAPVTSLSCLAAKAVLSDADFIKKTKKFTKEQRKLLIKALKKANIQVFPSQANNILIKTDWNSFRKFLKQNNISLVDASCFRGIPKGCFRITPRSKAKNKQLISLLQNYKK